MKCEDELLMVMKFKMTTAHFILIQSDFDTDWAVCI